MTCVDSGDAFKCLAKVEVLPVPWENLGWSRCSRFDALQFYLLAWRVMFVMFTHVDYNLENLGVDNAGTIILSNASDGTSYSTFVNNCMFKVGIAATV